MPVKQLAYAALGVFFFLMSPFHSFSQVPANPIGLNPSGLKWSQIQTNRVQVIFPNGLDAQGQRVANLVHYLWDQDTLSIGTKKAPVTILLQNQGVRSNGFLTVGPFRSEFYTTPPQFDCTADWLDLLTIHEYRHVQQFTNSRKGITEVVRRTLGSWPWGGLASTVMPRWYLEGDAVAAETAFSASGRGRLPAFQMEYKSLVEAGLRYDYEKAAAGSFKDYVPDWYALGYYMTAYGRKYHGADLWKKVTDDAVRYKGLTFSFNKSVERYTGMRSPALYEEMRTELDSLWTAEAADKKSLTVQLRSKEDLKEVTHYNNACYTSNRSLVVQRKSFDRITDFYRIDSTGNETLLLHPGLLGAPLNTRLSVAGTKICWAERAYDLRWGNRDYSIIKTYDFSTRKKTTLTRKSRYFAPAFSPGASRICAIDINQKAESTIVIMDSARGYVLQKLPNPEKYFFSFPTWTADGNAILVIAKKDGLQQLLRYNLGDERMIALSPPSASQLSHPVAGKKWVYFSAAYSGTNNIYAVDYGSGKSEREIFQLTDHIIGAFQPAISPDGKWLTYSAFNAKGYQLEEVETEKLLWKKIAVEPTIRGWYTAVLGQQETGDILQKVPNEEFEVKKFRKASGLFNPHSILPSFAGPEVGATILADNKFSTLSASMAGFYNLNEEEWSLFSNLNYAEFFPILNLNHRFAGRSTSLVNFSKLNDEEVVQTVYSDNWEEHNISAGLRLPLNFSTGRFFTFTQLRANYHRVIIQHLEGRFDAPENFRDTFLISGGTVNPDIFRPVLENGAFDALDLRFIFSTRQLRALQNLQSRWGLFIDARHRRTIGAGTTQGEVSYLRADAYLPGLSPNHSFYINTFYQKQDLLDNYRFSNFFVSPRGHIGTLRDKMFKLGFNYSFPLFYPDVSISRMAFLKRVKANLFYDHGFFRSDLFRDLDLRSAGMELTFDIRALRLVEVDLGVRYSYLIDPSLDRDEGRHQFTFLLISITQ